MPLHRLLWHSKESNSNSTPSSFNIELPDSIHDSSDSHLVQLTDIVLTGIQNMWEETVKLEITGVGGQEGVIHTITIPQDNYTNTSLLGILVSKWELEKGFISFSTTHGKLAMQYLGNNPARLTMSAVLAVKLGLTLHAKSHSDSFIFNFTHENKSLHAIENMNVNAFMERGVVILDGCSLTPKTLVASKDKTDNTTNLLSKSILATFKISNHGTVGDGMSTKLFPTLNFNQKICGSFSMGHNGLQCQITDSLFQPFPFHPQGDTEVLLTIQS